MHTFAGSVTIPDGEKVSRLPETWRKLSTPRPHGTTVYLSWETDTPNSDKLLENIRQVVGELVAVDISHTGDGDTVAIFSSANDGVYGYYGIHGATYEEVTKEYKTVGGVVSIRTAEDSQHLGDKVVKVDVIG